MANEAMVICTGIEARDPSQFTGTGSGSGLAMALTLRFHVSLIPRDGSVGANSEVEVTALITTPASVWRTLALAAIKAWGQNPSGTPGGYNITQIIGLTDIQVVLNP